MNKADKALADVRGWLCDNMSAGDAGKGCGMLSVVSRHITELEEENAELRQERDLYRELFHLTTEPDKYVQVRDENAKMRECLQDFADAIKNDDGFGVDRGWMLERIRELGIKED